MSTTNTPRVDLDAIERLDRECTPGPWSERGRTVAATKGRALTTITFVPSYEHGGTPLRESQANAAFIALSRTALPELVAMLRERDAEVARLRQACEEADDALSRHRRDDMGNYDMEVEAAITTLRAALTNATGESE